MLREKEKIVILAIVVVVMIVLGWIQVGLVSSMFVEPSHWIIWFTGIIMSLMLLLFIFLGGYAFWYVWKKVPTLTKKNEILLEGWLKDNGYVRCEMVKVVITRTFDYSVNNNGSLTEIDKKPIGLKMFVIDRGVVNEIEPSFENAVALLENYEYSVQENDFMILTFKYDKAKMLVYRQHPS